MLAISGLAASAILVIATLNGTSNSRASNQQLLQLASAPAVDEHTQAQPAVFIQDPFAAESETEKAVSDPFGRDTDTKPQPAAAVNDPFGPSTPDNAKRIARFEPSAIIQGTSQEEKKILQALNQRVRGFDFPDTPLSDAVQVLEDSHEIQIVIDQTALQDAGIDPSTTTINQSLHGISLRSALRLTLEPLQLIHVVRDEVLSITTEEAANMLVQVRVYDVSTIVVDNPEFEENADRLGQLLGEVLNADGAEQSVHMIGRGTRLFIRGTWEQHQQVLDILKAFTDHPLK